MHRIKTILSHLCYSVNYANIWLGLMIDSLPASVIPVEGPCALLSLEVVWLLRSLQFDAAELLAKLAQKHVLNQTGRNVILSQKAVEFLNLLSSHPTEAANSGHAQFPLTKTARHVVLDELAVLVADREGCLHRGLCDPVPVHRYAFEQLLLETDQPLLAHGRWDLQKVLVRYSCHVK